MPQGKGTYGSKVGRPRNKSTEVKSKSPKPLGKGLKKFKALPAMARAVKTAKTRK
jgi:hypothetical protein